MYKLIIEDDEGKTWIVPLIRDEISIGRKEGNTVRLTEKNVSRKHARLSKANGSVYIEDLSSYNGIKVNGDRIAGRAPIAEGDRVQIGDYQLALKLDKSAATDGAEGANGEAASFDKGTEPHATASPDAATRASPIISASGPPPAAETDRPARLVVVSSNFAGKEFRLDKPQMVIGRTDENDVVVNHRSISRHHAKIVREQGRYHVVDLGSANGVRVNGEEYGKVELRKGDHIDLGHVRLRFVAAGEDFLFSRDAEVVDVSTAGGDKKSPVALIATITVVLVLVIGVIAVVTTKKSGDGPVAAGAPAIEKPAAPAGKVDLGEINAAVDKALASNDWDTVIAKADEGLASAPEAAGLRNKKAKAETEKKYQAVFAEYQKAVKANDLGAAVKRYGEIPETSVYHEKAQESWGVVKGAYVQEELGKARGLQAQGKCEDAKQHVEEVLFIDEGNVEAQDIARKCGQAPPPPRVAHTPRTPSTPAPRVAREERAQEAAPEPAAKHEDAVVAAPAPAGGGDKLVTDAQDDYVHGNYQDAIDKARQAIKAGGTNAKAWRIVGASSCFLHDKPGAIQAWNKLGAMERQFLNYVCQRNNIKIP